MNYRLGTRQSKLALWQAHFVASELEKKGIICDIIPIKTTGDKILDVPLYDLGGKGLFVKDIQKALLNEEIDFAVHCLKDMETTQTEGLEIACILKREACEDVLISNTNQLLENLNTRARIGTCSPRREAFIKKTRPDLVVLPCRGNIDSRISKLQQGDYDAIVLAAAGLKRLDKFDLVTQVLDPTFFIPSAGQGVLAIECKAGNDILKNAFSFLHDEETAYCVTAERAVIQGLGGTCKTPAAAWGRLEDDTFQLLGFYENDSKKQTQKELTLPKGSCPIKAGQEMARLLLEG